MSVHTLDTLDCTGKHVLVRVDFNVPPDQVRHAANTFRLKLVKNTVDYILSFPDTTVTLLSHYGRPGGKPDPEQSLAPLVPIVSAILGQPVTFHTDCLASDRSEFQGNRVALLENVRFYKEEEENDADFALKLSLPYDLYVNEAFSVCHREHASVVAITEHLPSVAGLHLEEELRELSQIRETPERPAVALLGGNKIETKLSLIRFFEERYDTVLVGGKIANEALDQHLSFKNHVVFPVDFRSPDRRDIGDETVKLFIQHLKGAKTILWNGTLGKYEESPYDTSTKALILALLETSAKTVVGGGDSLAAIESMGVFEKFSFVSSGGGAMLEFLSGERLPGIEALSRS